VEEWVIDRPDVEEEHIPMEADRIVEALRRHVFRPGEDVETTHSEPDLLTVFTTKRLLYEAVRADWLIGGAPWVRDAVRVVRDSSMENFVATYGLIAPHDGDVLFLNEVATMRELGGRVGAADSAGLDPLAYAQLLGEVYSADSIDEPVVYPFAASYGFQAGWLIRDPVEFLREYPVAGSVGVQAPRVEQAGQTTTIDFFSHNFYHVQNGTAIDVYRWKVTATAGRPASWVRDLVAGQLNLPLPKD
jgi:hypothetical protein